MTSELIGISYCISKINQHSDEAMHQQQHIEASAQQQQRFDGLLDRLDQLRQIALNRKNQRLATRKARESQKSFTF